MKPLAFYVDSPFYFEQFEKADFVLRDFPDGESYLKINADIKNREIFIVNSLNNPNQKLLPLLFLVSYLREQGAKTIILISPYLPYMRQDKIFNPGEVLSSKYFAELLSGHIDKIITVDPHLHRYKNLSEIYRCENTVLHATHEIADYIKNAVKKPIIIGPDSESEQWAKKIADEVGAPYVIAQKKRMNDYDVDMLIPGMEKFKKNTPVLIDDIISTAQTMIKAVSTLRILGFAPPVCIGVHAVFAGSAYEDLDAAGPEKIVTCNSIKHISNGIDLAQLLSSAF